MTANFRLTLQSNISHPLTPRREIDPEGMIQVMKERSESGESVVSGRLRKKFDGEKRVEWMRETRTEMGRMVGGWVWKIRNEGK